VETLEAAQQERLKEGKELAERTAQQLRSAGFQAYALTEEGEPKTAILEKAAQWTADVIFMGSHGRKGIDRFLIGSASEAVLRHAPCSVEIVRIQAVEAA
jgi:nucleotide-binding universal stress UspA family protein